MMIQTKKGNFGIRTNKHNKNWCKPSCKYHEWNCNNHPDDNLFANRCYLFDEITEKTSILSDGLSTKEYPVYTTVYERCKSCLEAMEL